MSCPECNQPLADVREGVTSFPDYSRKVGDFCQACGYQNPNKITLDSQVRGHYYQEET